MESSISKLFQKQILIIDQVVSATTNYSPILIPLLLEDWTTLGQIVLFQSFYALILGITRASLGTSQLVFIHGKNSSHLLIYGFFFSILSGLISLFFFTDFSLNILFLLSIFIFPILQDILRFKFVGQKNPRKALESDLLWLATSVLIFIYLFSKPNSLTSILLLSWSLGAAPATVWLYIHQRMINKKVNSQLKDKISTRYLVKMASTGLLSEVNTIYVNWIVTFVNSAAFLGNFRYFQMVFLPIAFLINVNRLLLIPLYRDGMILSIRSLLKIQFKIRIFFYLLGFLFTIFKSGTQIDIVLTSIVTALSVELAFQRNTRYQSLLGTKNEKVVLANLIFYLLSSIILFTFVSQTGIILLLSFSLLAVELLAFITLRRTHTKNNV